MADNDSYVNGDDVQKQLARALAAIGGSIGGGGGGDEYGGMGIGLKRCALHVVARAKALAPEDTTSLVQSIHSEDRIVRKGDTLRVEVGAQAFSGDENYGWEIHEEQEYSGPNCGGSRTIGLGPKTEAKGVSSVEPTDGSAGGKYMTRPIANKPEVYGEIIARTIREKLDGKA